MEDISVKISTKFSDEAAKWLGEQAERRGLSLAELLRRIVDEVRGAYLIDRPGRPSPPDLAANHPLSTNRRSGGRAL
jgi:hypothetical protein